MEMKNQWVKFLFLFQYYFVPSPYGLLKANALKHMQMRADILVC